MQKSIEMIVRNVFERSYGYNSLDPTGPNLFGRAIALLDLRHEYAIGNFIKYTDETHGLSFGHFDHANHQVSRSLKKMHEGGELRQLGLTGVNNYNKIYDRRMIYGEKQAIAERAVFSEHEEPAKWIARLPWGVEKEFAKFLSTIGLKKDGAIAWKHAIARERTIKARQ